MNYQEMNDDLLHTAYITWYAMLENALETARANESLITTNPSNSSSSEEDLKMAILSAAHCRAISEEFKVRQTNSLKFSIEDVYVHIGKGEKYGMFKFYPGSDSFVKSGQEVHGKVVYKKSERDSLEEGISLPLHARSNGVIRIDSGDKDEKMNLMLRTEGFPVTDIFNIYNFNWDKGNDSYKKDGIKEIPGTINIPFDFSQIDPISFSVNFTKQLIKNGCHLPHHEMVKYHSYRLILEPDSVSKEDLAKYLLKEESQELTDEALMLVLGGKSDSGRALTELEENKLRELSSKRSEERLKIFMHGLGISKKDLNQFAGENRGGFYELLATIMTFETETLSRPGNKFPVYWDFSSFIHTFSRHYQAFRIDKSTYVQSSKLGLKKATPFQYKFKDIKRMASIIIDKLEEEISSALAAGKDYRKYGDQGYYYNGNYYQITVRKDGRLSQFHALE